MNALEQQAHAKLVDCLDLRRQKLVTRQYVEIRMSQLAGFFRERCNCGALLSRSADAGRQIVWCPFCGLSYKEYPLNDRR